MMNSARDEICEAPVPRRVAGTAIGAAAATAAPVARASRTALRHAPRRGAAPQPMAFWPSDPFHSHKLLRTISKTNCGAADFTEAYLAAQAVGRIPRARALVREFSALGHALIERADALDDADPTAAAGARLRASEYLRAAEFFLPPDTQLPAKVALFRTMRQTFARAVAGAEPRVTAVDVPYEGSALYAYRIDPLAAVDRCRHPTVILYGGLDSVGEEVYLWLGEQLARRGVAALVVDGPGQGASLRLRGIPSRPDYEVATKAVIDYLEAQPWADPARIGVVGISLGGYYAARSALDRRVRATVAWTGMWDLPGIIRSQRDPATLAFFGRQGPWVMGATTPLGAMLKGARFTMADVAGDIRGSVLITHGEDDDLVPVAQAHRLHDAIRAPKELHVFPSGTPGSRHCQVDSLPAAWDVVIPWLLDRLGA